MGQEDPKKPLISDKAPVLTAPSTAPLSVLPSEPPQYSRPHNVCSSFNRQW
jgi:hypothetical protein